MKYRKARSLAARAYKNSDTRLANAALEILRHRRRRDRVATGLAALVKGGGVSPFAFTFNGLAFTFGDAPFTYGAG